MRVRVRVLILLKYTLSSRKIVCFFDIYLISLSPKTQLRSGIMYAKKQILYVYVFNELSKMF